MTPEKQQIKIENIFVDVIRKDIKHLYFAVYPPNGRVRVSAPLRMNDEAVRQAVISKLPWIKRHQAKFEGKERQRPLEYVSGERHNYQGQRYVLNVIYHDGPPKVVVHHNANLDLYVRTGSDARKRERALTAWYRQQLKEAIPSLVAKWEVIIGEAVAEWGVKRMKTRWGSCNIKARRIWLNLELIKKPVHCLEYIIVHEMVHLKVRLHNDRFVAYMDEFMPQWRRCQDELDKTPLAHANLGY
ncbi:MAG: M48 family metallopeptidase [Anaerolineales bacterium]|nr:M48 family metallopeptidase [Anaerolineales bacterium]